MSGLQLVQTLNSTPFALLWLFHCGSRDISFLRKGLGVIKAVGTRNCRSPLLPPQCWRDWTGELWSVPDWWEGEIRRKSRVWKWNTPVLQWPSCIPSEQVCQWKGETFWYLSRDEASMGEGSCWWGEQHKGIQGRGMQWDAPAPSSQHELSEGAQLLDVQTSRWGAWLRHPTHQAGAQGAHARLPPVLCWHQIWDSTSVRPQIHSVSLEVMETMGRRSSPGEPGAVWCSASAEGRLVRVTLFLQVCRTHGSVALCVLRQNRCQQKHFLLNWHLKIVTRDP